MVIAALVISSCQLVTTIPESPNSTGIYSPVNSSIFLKEVARNKFWPSNPGLHGA